MLAFSSTFLKLGMTSSGVLALRIVMTSPINVLRLLIFRLDLSEGARLLSWVEMERSNLGSRSG